jgi:hypothetical protein
VGEASAGRENNRENGGEDLGRKGKKAKQPRRYVDRHQIGVKLNPISRAEIYHAGRVCVAAMITISTHELPHIRSRIYSRYSIGDYSDEGHDDSVASERKKGEGESFA